MKIGLVCILTRRNYQKQAQNMIANYVKELTYVYQDMNEAFCLVRKVLEEQVTTRNIL